MTCNNTQTLSIVKIKIIMRGVQNYANRHGCIDETYATWIGEQFKKIRFFVAVAMDIHATRSISEFRSVLYTMFFIATQRK